MTTESVVDESSAEHGEHRRGVQAFWRRYGKFIEPALVVVAFLIIYEILAETQAVGINLLPTVPRIVSAFVTDVTHGALWSATWVTLRSWLLGMAIVLVIGIPGGLLLGSSTVAYHGSHLTVEILRTVPSIAAVPFLVLLYGITTKLTVIIVVLAALWPLLIQTMAGARDVDPIARDTGRSYGLGRVRQFRQIVFPSTLPYIATGVRISATIGLLLAIGTSLFAGGQGLGNELTLAQSTFNNPLLFARTFFAGLLGLVVYYVLMAIERRTLAWHPSQRGSAL